MSDSLFANHYDGPRLDPTPAVTLDDVRHARAFLMRLAEPGTNHRFHAFIGEHGPVQALRRIQEGLAPAAIMPGGPALESAGERVTRDFDTAERLGARLVIPEDVEWPTQVPEYGWDLAPAPLGLWVRGTENLGSVAQFGVALVGSRASTAYGDHMAGQLARDLVHAHGRTVISGGAYGVDAAAHRGAIAADGVTVAVLGCGIDRVYPASHAALFDRILDNGLLVSESAPSTAPAGHRFLSRNRLIGALSTGLVVVEAAGRSGSLNAARQANEIGRPVMAVPGPANAATSVGCHQLIRSGATLVTSADDIVAAIKEGI